ncbi:MAG: hypothetical protein AAF638_13555 [Pseudomonadota bacterium]
MKHGIGLLLGMALFVSAPVGGPAVVNAQPSYNCSVQLNPTEQAICDNGTLARLDSAMAGRFHAHFENLSGTTRTAFREDQTRWRLSRDGCGTNIACIGASYGQRIAEIRTAAGGRGAAAPEPERAGNVRILSDGTFERTAQDGSRFLRYPDGDTARFNPDGSRVSEGNVAMVQVPNAGLPALPDQYAQWGTGLSNSLLGILRNLLQEEEYVAYLRTEEERRDDYYRLLDWRLRSISFLTGT